MEVKTKISVENGQIAKAHARMRATQLDLARHVDSLGVYERYWLAEHHNLAGVASAATAVLIGHVAAVTRHIRVGSGGIMLPNHAPLLIAEQFGTLEALYPGRIDLGLGRAPGTDATTLRALRRSYATAESFPQDVEELLAFLDTPEPGQRIVAVPGAGSRVPVWILGSSLFGASSPPHCRFRMRCIAFRAGSVARRAQVYASATAR